MMTFSYLDFLDKPTHENIVFVRKTVGLLQKDAAALAGISFDSYKGWETQAESTKARKPTNQTWNLYLYELEARRLGYDCLLSAFREIKVKKIKKVKNAY